MSTLPRMVSKFDRTAGEHSHLAALVAAIGAVALTMMCLASSAKADAWVNAGTFPVDGGGGFVALPSGIAIDQAADEVYVTNFLGPELSPTQIFKFDLDGAPASPASFGSGKFSGVAVDSSAGRVFGLSDERLFDVEESAPTAIKPYTTAGASAGSDIPVEALYNIHGGRFNQIATDSAGNVYYPSIVDDEVKVFEADGTELTPIGGEGEAALTDPNSVAVDDNDNLYVVDATGGGRVQKFDSTGAFDAVIDNSGEATGLGVNPETEEVYVVRGAGTGTHVVAYDAEGIERGQFGAGDFSFTLVYAFSQVAVDVDSGRVYVSDPGAAEVEMFDPLPPPTIATEPASAISQTGAKLNATVNANGLDAQCAFEYDIDPALESAETVPCVPNPVIGGTDTPVSATITEGLQPNTTYYFRVTAENEGGPSAGEVLQFTTLPEVPVAATGAAGAIGQSGATLTGTVNANGAVTSCEFEYGTTTSYGASIPCSPDPVNGEAATPVSAAIDGLSAATTYHYRVVAENAAGESVGEDVTFTTDAIPPDPPSPPSPTPQPAPAPPADSSRQGNAAKLRACIVNAQRSHRKARKGAVRRARRVARATRGRVKARARARRVKVRAMRAANRAKVRQIRRCRARFGRA